MPPRPSKAVKKANQKESSKIKNTARNSSKVESSSVNAPDTPDAPTTEVPVPSQQEAAAAELSQSITNSDPEENVEDQKAQEDALAAQSITPKKPQSKHSSRSRHARSGSETINPSRAQRRKAQKATERIMKRRAKKLVKLDREFSKNEAEAKLSNASVSQE